jgi:3-oxoacyl-[acyl-carrier protein] reductase
MSNERKVLLVTGTSKGIGRAIAEHYLGAGWFVVGCSRGASTIASERYVHYCVDITDEPASVRMVREIVRIYGKIDALVNNAGVASMNHILTTPTESARKIFNINVLGTLTLLREVAKIMTKTKHGRIVNLSSVANPMRLEGEAVYAASKAAVETLTRIAARELAPFNITVNAIGPTPIETDLIKAVPAAKIDALLRRQAIGRLGTFGDVINVIEFFLAPQSSFITGQVLYLGGA